ncbi:MAG: hypothetical protein WCI55_13635 [Armatimonadota bacterium]
MMNSFKGCLLLVVLSNLICCAKPVTLADEIKGLDKATLNANEDKIILAEDQFTDKVLANASFSNDELLRASLEPSTSISAVSGLFVALDKRGYKFTTEPVINFLMTQDFNTVRGRLGYVRFLRDGNESDIRSFLKKYLPTRSTVKSQAVCWGLTTKKFPRIVDLKKDPKLAVILKNFKP